VRVKELSEQYGFSILEDACHALGAAYRGKKVGSCTFSDAAVFSFHPAKIITTGEGGMVVTNNPGIVEKVCRLRNHGITRNGEGEETGKRPWVYRQIDLGHNYRMTDIQAALGISQMRRIDSFVARRREIARAYDLALESLPVVLPWQHPDSESAFHLYVIRIDPEKTSAGRLAVFNKLRENGIRVNVHYIPVHTQPYFENAGFKNKDFPESERYYETALTLPMFYGLARGDQDRVVEILKAALS
ncbi:MAG: DegT/DnrJ/EryC1/StrS family aminotransferase, partial [Nitrospinaceae bacterium]